MTARAWTRSSGSPTATEWVADVFAKAGGNAVNNAALLQKFLQQPAVGLDGLLHLVRELQLGAKLDYGDEFLQGGLAVGERDAGNGSGGFYRQIHDWFSFLTLGLGLRYLLAILKSNYRANFRNGRT